MLRQIIWCAIIFWSSLLCVRADTILVVPHLMEYGVDIGVISGAETCGPCSLEMCAAYLGHRVADFNNVKKINALLWPNQANDDYFLSHGSSTSLQQLVQMANQFYNLNGIAMVDFSIERIKQEINNGGPVILAIKYYGAITTRTDTYDGPHVLVINGYDEENAICQDPDNPNPNVKYKWSEIVAANSENWQMIVGFKPTSVSAPIKIARPIEESQKPLLDLKGQFFQGDLYQVLDNVTYKVWIMEQVGNHLMILEEKASSQLFGETKRVIDFQNCFLRQAENTPVGKNCLVIEMANCQNVTVDQPANVITQSAIYLNPYVVQFLYQVTLANGQNPLSIGLALNDEVPVYPNEVNQDLIAKTKKQWFGS